MAAETTSARDESGDSRRSLDADLRRGAELIESTRQLLAMLPGRISDLPEDRRAAARRLIRQLIDAADELDGMLLGIAAQNAGIHGSAVADPSQLPDDGPMPVL